MCVCARPRGMSKRVGELSWVPGENHRGTLHLTRPMRTYVTWMSIRIYERRYVHVNFYCRLPRCIGGLVVSRLPDAHPPTDLSALPFPRTSALLRFALPASTTQVHRSHI